MSGEKDTVLITLLSHSQIPIQQPSFLEEASSQIPQHALRTSPAQLHYPKALLQLLQESPKETKFNDLKMITIGT